MSHKTDYTIPHHAFNLGDPLHPGHTYPTVDSLPSNDQYLHDATIGIEDKLMLLSQNLNDSNHLTHLEEWLISDAVCTIRALRDEIATLHGMVRDERSLSDALRLHIIRAAASNSHC